MIAQPGAESSAPAVAVVQTPVVEAPSFTPHTETPTLLDRTVEAEVPAETPSAEVVADATGGTKPVDPTKPVETKTDPEAKPGEEKAEDEILVEAPKAEPVVYEDFALPEGMKLGDEAMGKFKNILGNVRVPQDVAQKLVDLHVKAYQQQMGTENQRQHDNFGNMRKGWRDQAMSDEQMGGAAWNTTLSAVARTRDKLVPEANAKAFDEMLRVTGVGDHPEFVRLLHNASRLLDEPRVPKTQGNPAPSNGKAPGKGGLRSLYNPMSS